MQPRARRFADDQVGEIVGLGVADDFASELAAAGVRLRLVPHMTHAKAIVFDDALALAGSANLDARSLFLNYELMVAFEAPADVARFVRAIESIAADARVWRPSVIEPGLPRRLAEGLVLWLAFQL